MFRVGILIDGEHIQSWQAECIKQIKQSGLTEISVLIINQSSKPSGGTSPFLYRAYRKLDRMLFKTKQDAFEPISIFSILNTDIRQLLVYPIQGKYTDSFPDSSLKELKGLNLDILIRFGFRILKGEVLSIPKLGVWSYHHGDPIYYRGGPPAFWEVVNNQVLTSAVLLRITEKLDEGNVLYQTFTQTDPLSVQRNANKIFWASATFVSRVIKEIDLIGVSEWSKKLNSTEPKSQAPLWRPPDSLAMLKAGKDLLGKTLKRKIQEQANQPHWNIAFVESILDQSLNQLSPNETELFEHPNPTDYYLADPFIFQHQGMDYLFAEEFNKRSGKGRIVYLIKEGTQFQVFPVLEKSCHLSYPFIFEHQEEIYMIPEAAESGKITLYKALDFPLNWESHGIFFNQEAYDPTLVKKDGLFWLFVNQKAHPTCSPFDELHLYWTENLENPNWTSHPQNPIISDVRMARPAGRVFQEDSVWYRPAQDSGLRYGHQVQIQKVTSWSKEEYQEITVQTLTPKDALGVHTFNKSGSGVWVDFYSRL